MLSFNWEASGISFDDPTSQSPTAQFPLGSTTVSLVVNDGLVDSEPDSSLVSVVDTTEPVISLNGDANISLECAVDSYSELGASASDICDNTLTMATG